MNTKPLLQIKNLEVAYGSNIVLNNINLDIFKGDYVVIIGGNGSGKSTLLKTILGLTSVKIGQILYKGKSINQETVAKNFGYLAQHSDFFRDFPITVKELIKLECNISTKSCPFNPSYHLKILDADSLVDKSISKLSGGELQKVMISRALITNPSVLLLDEPSNNLDKETNSKLLKLLSNLWKIDKKTIIHVTHHLGDMEKIGKDIKCYRLSESTINKNDY